MLGVDADQTRAAFLFNFTKFTIWPRDKFTSEVAPLRVGFIGTGPVRDYFEEANQSSRRYSSHPIVTSSILGGADVKNCHIIFVCTERDGVSGLLAEARRNNVLTIGQSDHFIPQGGMVVFVNTGSGVKLRINERTVRRAGLKISSGVMGMATLVGDDGQPAASKKGIFD
jgi:hypothetical protein